MSTAVNEHKPSLLRRVLVICVPILIVVGFFVAMQTIVALKKEPEEKRRPFNTLAVMADYAVKEDVFLTVNAQGEAQPSIEIDLVPEVGGKIIYVSPNFVQGGIIKKGETLIRIDTRDYDVALIRAKAGVAQAQQILAREVAEGDVAARDYEDLGIGGTPSPLALRIPQRQQAEASLQAAQAEVQAAELQLTRTSVRAPFDGRVKSKSSDIGKFVSPGSPLGRIFSADIIEVRLALSDADLSKLDLPLAFAAKSRKDAPKVELSAVVAGKRRLWDGSIMRTDSTYDTQTRALFAIVEVFDPYGKGASEDGVPLAPGLFVDAKIIGKSYENVIVIPRDGLRPANKVYVVNDKGKSQIRDVEVIDTNSKRAIISSGIEGGELVILSPMEESRTTMTLKALDINDPSNVLVDPPEPEWMKKAAEKKAAEAEDGKKKKKKRGKDADTDGPPKRKSDESKAGTDTGSSDNSTAGGGDN